MPRSAILLDTCALIWLAGDAPELSAEARDTIDQADIAGVSAISAWEISLKVARGSLDLPFPSDEWFSRTLEHHHLTLANLSVNILIAANSLPWHHRDPADRFIIATAIEEGASVVTADGRFHLYGLNVIC